jgi:hypothetical protein
MTYSYTVNARPLCQTLVWGGWLVLTAHLIKSLTPSSHLVGMIRARTRVDTYPIHPTPLQSLVSAPL